MGTKAYSTRFDPDFDQAERELAMILDLLDTDETGQMSSGQWLREAARRRIYADQENEQTMIDPVIVTQAEPIQQESQDFNLIDPKNAIEEQVFARFNLMDPEARKEWIKQAVLMRFALENDPCSFIVNRWMESNIANKAVFNEAGSQVVESPDQPAEDPVPYEPSITNETIPGLPEVETAQPEDELTPYRVALQKLMSLEWGYD